MVFTENALDRADRVLADQRGRVGAGPSFNDYVPYVFDCACAVARTLNAEAAPALKVNQAMADWWRGLHDDEELKHVRIIGRNGELKGGIRALYEQMTMTGPEANLVVGPIYFESVAADGGRHRGGVKHVLSAAEGTLIEWMFRSGPWEDLEFFACMEKFLQRWRSEILPAANAYVAATPGTPTSNEWTEYFPPESDS